MAEFDDETKRDVLRAVAEDLRAEESSEAEKIAALVHRVSDRYDESEVASSEALYRNMRHILDVSERGGLRR
ncbi:hypothetical protein EFA46_008510 [Halarchaeum sp. CBA1220]|uniref:hypothetical protein n=1 Tax=Halarchaeum sp. CBA1220 TaxID=1853682 RepID=UPI000F3A85CD|nr:hypothetical protein [Halarchaeum sp. CBA1220]QLC34244.1 hypothetical protein EFA46_008510 [Halarchaeum sp. CBA1220]